MKKVVVLFLVLIIASLAAEGFVYRTYSWTTKPTKTNLQDCFTEITADPYSSIFMGYASQECTKNNVRNAECISRCLNNARRIFRSKSLKRVTRRAHKEGCNYISTDDLVVGFHCIREVSNLCEDVNAGRTCRRECKRDVIDRCRGLLFAQRPAKYSGVQRNTWGSYMGSYRSDVPRRTWGPPTRR